MKKIVLISSVGGHLEQLLGLDKIIDKYDVSIITEKNNSTKKLSVPSAPIYLLPYVSRRFVFPFLFNYIKVMMYSLKFFFKIKPEIIISAGAGCTLPICVIGKFFGRKVIFIETFSRVKTKTITGKLCYHIADIFIVQWKELLNIYPKAVYLGHIY